MTETFLSGLPWPDGTPITQYFGGQHFGLDGGMARGTPLKARASGLVVPFTNDGSFGLGACVQYDDEPLYGLTAHMDRVDVRIGDRVSDGQLLGLSGNTGTSTGPHCHYDLCVDTRFRRDIRDHRDPLTMLIPEEEMALANEILEAVFGDKAGLDAWLARQKDPNVGIAPVAQQFLLLTRDGGSLDRRFKRVERKVLTPEEMEEPV